MTCNAASRSTWLRFSDFREFAGSCVLETLSHAQHAPCLGARRHQVVVDKCDNISLEGKLVCSHSQGQWHHSRYRTFVTRSAAAAISSRRENRNSRSNTCIILHDHAILERTAWIKPHLQFFRFSRRCCTRVLSSCWQMPALLL